MAKPILCLDFDGVIHRYDSPWAGACVIKDRVTEGFFKWAEEAAKHFRLVVYSSRSKEVGAADAMLRWLGDEYARETWPAGDQPTTFWLPFEIEFAYEKPAAFLTIDDRGMTFMGSWTLPSISPESLLRFKPWNKS